MPSWSWRVCGFVANDWPTTCRMTREPTSCRFGSMVVVGDDLRHVIAIPLLGLVAHQRRRRVPVWCLAWHLGTSSRLATHCPSTAGAPLFPESRSESRPSLFYSFSGTLARLCDRRFCATGASEQCSDAQTHSALLTSAPALADMQEEAAAVVRREAHLLPRHRRRRPAPLPPARRRRRPQRVQQRRQMLHLASSGVSATQFC